MYGRTYCQGYLFCLIVLSQKIIELNVRFYCMDVHVHTAKATSSDCEILLSENNKLNVRFYCMEVHTAKATSSV